VRELRRTNEILRAASLFFRSGARPETAEAVKVIAKTPTSPRTSSGSITIDGCSACCAFVAGCVSRFLFVAVSYGPIQPDGSGISVLFRRHHPGAGFSGLGVQMYG
jgi:hypothetical protein